MFFPRSIRRILHRSLLGATLAAAVLVSTAHPAAAVTPSVSPSVQTTNYVNAFYNDCKHEGEFCLWCPGGYSCAIVDDDQAPNRSRVFYFYHCRTYSVQHWRGWGSFINHQTDGARTYLYGRSMKLLKSVPADSRLHFYDFEPVWYVKAC